jgi:hypothetical protein
MNMKSEELSPEAARRFIADHMDRAAMTKVLYGKATEALAEPEHDDGSREALSGEDLSLVYLESDQDIGRTATMIRWQLGQQHISVRLRPLALKDYVSACTRGDFDLTLLPIPQGRRGYATFLGRDHPESTNFAGYSNADYDRAYDEGDEELLDDLLERDLPVTMLFEQQYFAALDADLCLPASTTADPTSWRWIADLYPCAKGQGK